MHHEVYVECATCRSGYARLDTYDEEAREILSRKYAQLWAINERTAKLYIDELATKSRPGTMSADLPSSRLRALDGKRLEGDLVLEIPVQSAPVPQWLIDYAMSLRNPVVLRDETGRVYR